MTQRLKKNHKCVDFHGMVGIMLRKPSNCLKRWHMKVIYIAAIAFALTGCNYSSYSEGAQATRDTSNRDYYHNDELIVRAKAQFHERNFGNSYRLFKEAIDVNAEDPQAWLGFAASADMMRRFDKAEFAYRKLKPTIGNRIEFLNNYGYSHLLRGNLRTARSYFLKAYELDPSNEFAANNLEMLRNSVNYPKRARGDLKGI